MGNKFRCYQFVNKIKQYICFFLFVPFSLYGQDYMVSGIIKNQDSLLLDGANVIVKTIDGNTIAFGASNEDGVFKIKVNSGSYIIKISNLGYKPNEQEIKIEDSNLNLGYVKLIESSTELDEVILKAENNGVFQKGDKTLYKIDKFLNGTEDNLKDIITKLPGLGINDNGKITANGKTIDKLLVDGEDLFKSQHQLATENLSSEMVKNVELIRNYKDFESVTKNDNTGVTALNVNIKEDFKNKFTGNVEAYVGIKDKYKLNLPVFNFHKKIKFTALTNINNTGESPIGVEDYFSLIEGAESKSSSGDSEVTFTNLEDVPRFVIAGDKVKSRSNNFLSVSSIFNLNKKAKIDFYTIFNNTNQEESFFRNTILNPSLEAIQINEQNLTIEENYFAALKLKSIYKFNTQTVLSFSNNLNIDHTNQNNSIENNIGDSTQFIEEKYQPKQTVFNSTLSFKKNVNNNKFTSNLFFNYNKKDNQIIINANEAFLDLDFENDIFSISQKIYKDSKESGFNLDYTINKEKSIVNFYSKSIYKRSELLSEVVNQFGFDNDLRWSRFSNTFGTNFTFKISNVLDYSLGLGFNNVYNKLNNQSDSVNFLDIQSSVKAVFSSNKIAKLSYNYSNATTTIDNLIDENIIKNYRNLTVNDNVVFNNIFPYHQFNLSQFVFNAKAKSSFIFNASLNVKNKSINNNFLNTNNVSISKNVVIDKDKTFNTFVFFDKEFKGLPLSFSGSLSYGFSEKDYFQNNVKSLFKSENISSHLKINSTFKNSPVYFDIGYKYSKSIFYNNENKSNLLIARPYLNLNGNLSKQWSWNLNSMYNIYRTSNAERDLFSLSPELKFKKNGSNWELRLVGSNILNLTNQNIIENIGSANSLDQRVTSILSGYLILGIKMKF